MPLAGIVTATGTTGDWYWPQGTNCTTIPTWIPRGITTVSTTSGTQPIYTSPWVREQATQVGTWSNWLTANELREMYVREMNQTPLPIGPTDQELYQKAVAEHDTQEAERLLRQIRYREELEASRLAAQQAQREANAVREREREVAKDRANNFLLQHLTKPQQETFKKNGWFVVEGGRTKTKYRIRSNGIVGNIDVLNDDKVIHRLCGHIPASKVPIGDQLLAQKMMLESSEDDFLRVANRHPA